MMMMMMELLEERILASVAPQTFFEESYYLAHNADVAAAVQRGMFRSGWEHFQAYGQRENRTPSVFFDPAFYGARNLDAAAAVAAGTASSLYMHFVQVGDAQGRQGTGLFDEQAYRAMNPDVDAAVAAQQFGSGFDHFVMYGEREGRRPSALFDPSMYLASNPDVAAAVRAKQFATGLAHYEQYGVLEGRSGGQFQKIGVDFGPYMYEGETETTDLTEAQIRARLTPLAPFVDTVRSYTTLHGMQVFGKVAHELGMKAEVGLWLDKDAVVNEAEIQNVIAMAKAGQVDEIIAGSEVGLRGSLTITDWKAYITEVKQGVPAGVVVSAADTDGIWLANPSLVDVVDKVQINMFPYWENTTPENGAMQLQARVEAVQAIAQGKPVALSEYGNPYEGSSRGSAVPSVGAQSYLATAVVDYARTKGLEAKLFEAYSEPWKGAGVEGHWGLFTKGFMPMPGLEAALTGRTTPLWRGQMVGGAGVPAIYIDAAALGQSNSMSGHVSHVYPAEVHVDYYILVRGGWWKKPYGDGTVAVDANGNFTGSIVTGGVDQEATEAYAFLLPKGVSAPMVLGQGSLPGELFGYPYAVVNR